MILTEKNECNRGKTCPSTTFSTQISHRLTWDRNQASVLTTIARLSQSGVIIIIIIIIIIYTGIKIHFILHREHSVLSLKR
jgi:hypothetical protein